MTRFRGTDKVKSWGGEIVKRLPVAIATSFQAGILPKLESFPVGDTCFIRHGRHGQTDERKGGGQYCDLQFL